MIASTTAFNDGDWILCVHRKVGDWGRQSNRTACVLPGLWPDSRNPLAI